jgi:hypothetical protein
MRVGSLPLLLPLLGLVAAAQAGLLSGCAGTRPRIDRQELRTSLESLEAGRQAGRTGTVSGNMYLLYPSLPTLLRDHPVTLLPLSPALEAAVQAMGAQYSRTREPLLPAELERARGLLRESQEAISALGHPELIRTSITEPKEAAFTFSAVPEGRWLLLAEFEDPLSRLLWAIPVSVQAGQTARLPLNDETIWLEGLRPLEAR